MREGGALFCGNKPRMMGTPKPGPCRGQARGGRIAVVIPALNAAATLGGVLLRTRSVLGEARICLVDDGSEDGTGELAEALGCLVVQHPRNLGKGAALRTGFAAIGTAADLVLTIDADGQHDPSDIPRFIQALNEQGLDIVLGDRMSDTRAMPSDRYLSNRLSSAVVSSLAHIRIRDSQCGFRLFRTQVLDHVRLTTVRFETESEFLIRAAWAGFRIGSLPIATIYRGGQSHIMRWRDTLRFLKLMVRLYGESHGLCGAK